MSCTSRTLHGLFPCLHAFFPAASLATLVNFDLFYWDVWPLLLIHTNRFNKRPRYTHLGSLSAARIHLHCHTCSAEPGDLPHRIPCSNTTLRDSPHPPIRFPTHLDTSFWRFASHSKICPLPDGYLQVTQGTPPPPPQTAGLLQGPPPRELDGVFPHKLHGVLHHETLHRVPHPPLGVLAGQPLAAGGQDGAGGGEGCRGRGRSPRGRGGRRGGWDCGLVLHVDHSLLILQLADQVLALYLLHIFLFDGRFASSMNAPPPPPPYSTTATKMTAELIRKYNFCRGQMMRFALFTCISPRI